MLQTLCQSLHHHYHLWLYRPFSFPTDAIHVPCCIDRMLSKKVQKRSVATTNKISKRRLKIHSHILAASKCGWCVVSICRAALWPPVWRVMGPCNLSCQSLAYTRTTVIMLAQIAAELPSDTMPCWRSVACWNPEQNSIFPHTNAIIPYLFRQRPEADCDCFSCCVSWCDGYRHRGGTIVWSRNRIA